MRYLILALSAALIFPAMLPAASPIGSITSPETFMLRGHSVPAAGIPNWPLIVGDEIATTSAPALVQFRDGSRVVLSENSRAKIEQNNGTAVFRVQSGSAAFQGSRNPQVAFFVDKASVAAPVGSYSQVVSSSGRATAESALQGISTATRALPVRTLSGR